MTLSASTGTGGGSHSSATAGPCPYLSGLRSTMPITNTFLPGLMPPLMCPQNGTICKGGGERQEVYRLLAKSQVLGPENLTHQKARKCTRREKDKGRDREHIDLPVVGSTRRLELENPGSCSSAHHQVSKNRSTQIGFPQTLVYEGVNRRMWNQHKSAGIQQPSTDTGSDASL